MHESCQFRRISNYFQFFLFIFIVLAHGNQNVPAKIQVTTPASEVETNIENTEMTEIDEGQNGNGPKRRFLRQPIPKKVKRLRRNRRLRKILTPKNALMSLHELLGPALSEFSILPEERGFVATVFVNNVQYEGRGKRLRFYCIFFLLVLRNETVVLLS